MTYEELKSFTWEELSSLTYYQLKMDKYELLVKAQNSQLQLPDEITMKLQQLCSILSENFPEEKKTLSGLNITTVGEYAKSCTYILKLFLLIAGRESFFQLAADVSVSYTHLTLPTIA